MVLTGGFYGGGRSCQGEHLLALELVFKKLIAVALLVQLLDDGAVLSHKVSDLLPALLNGLRCDRDELRVGLLAILVKAELTLLAHQQVRVAGQQIVVWVD